MSRKKANRSMSRRASGALADHRRRAKKLGLSLDYDLVDLRRLAECALGQPCVYCTRAITEASWSCDHITPTSRGGGFGLANLRVCCLPCNHAKGALTHAEFLALLQVAWAWPEEARKDLLARLRAGGRRFGRKG